MIIDEALVRFGIPSLKFTLLSAASAASLVLWYALEYLEFWFNNEVCYSQLTELSPSHENTFDMSRWSSTIEARDK